MTRRLIARTPLAVFLRHHGRHRAHRVHPAPQRIECEHGLVRCACRPNFRPGVAGVSALSIPTKPYPLVRTQPTPYPDPVPHPTGPGGPR